MFEYENDKQVHTSTVGTLEKKETIRDENDEQVLMSTQGPLKKKEMLRYEKGKQVRTYEDVVSTGKISNEREE